MRESFSREEKESRRKKKTTKKKECSVQEQSSRGGEQMKSESRTLAKKTTKREKIPPGSNVTIARSGSMFTVPAFLCLMILTKMWTTPVNPAKLKAI